MFSLKKTLARQFGRVERSSAPEAGALVETDAPCGWPPGHFYSPIPSRKEVRAREAAIFDRRIRPLPGIDLNPEGQLELLRQFTGYFADFPFGPEPRAGLRFHLDNPNFGPGEALILTSWLRHFPPRRIIEIGSGYSSCAILDVVDRFLDPSVACTFLDPFPELLLSLLSEKDRQRVRIVSSQVQDLELAWFNELRSGDLLFIDSSHVSKTGSDVNFLLFEILPALAPGVVVHFHDIYYPFEYPREWVDQGRAWNEAYLLRAFLQYNAEFRIRFWNGYAAGLARESGLSVPLLHQHPGSSLWLEKQGARNGAQ